MHEKSTTNDASVAATVRQRIEIPYSYVAGPAMTRFLTGLKEGVFLASVCSGCGRRSVPPVSFCGRCWNSIREFAPAGPGGVLESYTEIPADSPDSSSPIILGLIRLEGADAILLHRIDPGNEVVRCGAPVEAVWRDDRSGSILDLTGFRLVGTTAAF